MIQSVSLLLAVAFLSFISKDWLLMAASLVLAVPAALEHRAVLGFFQKNAFSIGIFFLMIFILLPIANRKILLSDIGDKLLSLEGVLAFVAGLGVSYVGGQGIGVLTGRPAVLAGVVLGTLVAVLFMDGLPAGLIIAAGAVGLLGRTLM